MGRVLSARRREDGTVVAAKFLQGESFDREQVVRFAEEARVLGRLGHPGLLTLLDLDVDGPIPWIVTEFVEGETLSGLLSLGPLPLVRAVGLARQLADAMAHAHAAGILHRDLKSDNVMVTPADRLVVMDFGLARRADRTAALTATGVVMGTPLFMAPEQALGRPLTAAVDLYAAGVIFFHMLTGALPFDDPDLSVLIRHHLSTPTPDPRKLNPGLPPALASLVLQMLAKKPDERPVSFTAVGALLTALQPDLPLPSSSPASPAPTRAVASPTLDASAVVPRRAGRPTSSILAPRHLPAPPAPSRARRLPLAVLAIIVVALATVAVRGVRRPLTVLDAAVEAGPQRARVTWRTETPARFSWEIRSQGSVLRRSEEAAPALAHELLIQGLSPSRDYELRLVDTQGSSTVVGVTTTKPRLLQGVFAITALGRIFLDLATDLDRDLAIDLACDTGATSSTRIATASTAVVLPLPGPSDPAPTSVAWTLRSDDLVLARGLCAHPQEPLAKEVPAVDHAEAQRNLLDLRGLPGPTAGGLIWSGGRFFVTDDSGRLWCYEPFRTTATEPPASPQPSARALWVFEPPRQARLSEKYRRVGGLTALPDGRIVFVVAERGGSLRLWCLDPDERCARWADRLSREPALSRGWTQLRPPPWALAETDPWIREPGSREWSLPLPDTRGVTGARPGLLVDGLVVIPVQSWDRRVGWLALDPTARSLVWLSLTPGIEAQKAPILDDRDEGRWRWANDMPVPADAQGLSHWAHPTGPTVVAGGHLAQPIDLWRFTEGSPHQHALLLLPLRDGRPAGPPQIPFRWWSRVTTEFVVPHPTHVDTVTSLAVLRWQPGASTPAAAVVLPPALDGSCVFGGPPVNLGPVTCLLALLRPPGDEENILGAFHRVGTLALVDDDPTALVRRVRPLPGGIFDDMDEKLPGTVGFAVAGTTLAGATNHVLYAMDPETRQAGAWKPDLVVRIDAWALAPDGRMAAAVNGRGGVYVVPPTLLLDRSGIFR